MPDLHLVATITRDLLSLPDLLINDHETYYVTADSLGRATTWNRNQVASPFLDGSVTTFRSRAKVMSQVGVEVTGDTRAQLQVNARTLIEAFCQAQFTLTVGIGDSMNGASYAYDCEAADYTEVWTGPRWVARQLQVMFTVPNQPVLLAG